MSYKIDRELFISLTKEICSISENIDMKILCKKGLLYFWITELRVQGFNIEDKLKKYDRGASIVPLHVIRMVREGCKYEKDETILVTMNDVSKVFFECGDIKVIYNREEKNGE